mgnify:FL=1|jgi:hypothetical protein
MTDPIAAYMLTICAGCVLLFAGLAWLGFRK